VARRSSRQSPMVPLLSVSAVAQCGRPARGRIVIRRGLYTFWKRSCPVPIDVGLRRPKCRCRLYEAGAVKLASPGTDYSQRCRIC
jgi:hypothetical protein